MNVASLELCKELYELSGWVSSDWHKRKNPTAGYKTGDKELDARYIKGCPAYDLGYLLRKLPQMFNLYPDTIGEEFHTLTVSAGSTDHWDACYGDTNDPYMGLGFEAKTPEDALCLLAIELFKQGILQKEAA